MRHFRQTEIRFRGLALFFGSFSHHVVKRIVCENELSITFVLQMLCIWTFRQFCYEEHSFSTSSII